MNGLKNNNRAASKIGMSAYEHRLSDVVFTVKREPEPTREEKELFRRRLNDAIDREWKNSSWKIIVRDEAGIEAGTQLPWPEIIVCAQKGGKTTFQLTHNSRVMMLFERSDPLAFETSDRSIAVATDNRRMEIRVHGSRKQRKRLKKLACRLIELQLSAYYNVNAEMIMSRRKRAYVFRLIKKDCAAKC